MKASVDSSTHVKDTDQTMDACQTSEEEELRRSGRIRNPTEKMLALQREEAHKKERRLIYLYEQWKIQVRKAREQLKSDIPESQIATLIDSLEESKDVVTDIYVEIRDHLAPSSETRRRVDACEAVTKDIVKVAYERIAGVEDFDSETVKLHLRELLKQDYAQSIYGSTVSPSSQHSSLHSASSIVTAKRAEAAAELAAKEAEYDMLLKEERQREKIQLLEEQQKRALEAQKRELERLKAEKNVKAAQARLVVYNQEAMQEASIYSAHPNSREQQHLSPQHISAAPIHQHASSQQSISSSPIQQPTNVPRAESPPHTDVTYLAQAVQDTISMNRLPMPEPSLFTGDPIQFIEWKASFTALIDRKNIPSADKLHYLRKYIGGPARKTLDGIFYRNDDEAYKDAWDRLNHRYGQPFIIQRAFREKLSSWPKIQSKDAEGFRTFADFLHTCQEAMPHVKGLEILNDCEENQKLLQKLPDWAASRWNREVTHVMKLKQDFPNFQDFVNFMLMEAEVVCNPITSFHALRSTELPTQRHMFKEKRSTSSVLHTQAVTQNESHVQSTTALRLPCIFCQDSKHRLHCCPEFKGKSLEERRRYVKEKKLCYGCLKPGHGAKECRHRHSCDTCKGRHPTCLHDENYKTRDGRERNVHVMNTAPNATSDPAAVTALNVTKVGHSGSTSMIVPVWVSSAKNPSKEQLVYALLDTQSDSTFIDEEISHQLQADSCPVKLKLTTMLGANMIIKSQRVSELRVRGYNSSIHIDLPPSYTKDCIPVNRDHIPTHETAKQWSHLTEIADKMPQLLSCNVGLLIGYNCPRALAPRKVLTGKNNEPYAILTDLGWSIVGGSTPYLHETESSLCYKVTLKELPPVTPIDVLSALESDFKDTKGDDKTVSQEDLVFLDKLKEGIKKNDKGHYEMPLPFRQRPQLPDNKRLAEIRLSHLRRKLNRDEKYKKDYTTYMQDIIERGDAEEVHDEGIHGERWYIPHHGIYHPKKPSKLRVVFDCSANYGGTSLNDHLLSGPDLINNLTGILLRFRRHPIALLCDVEKMFHQFHVHEADRNYLRFLWWKNGDTNTQPQTYRMKVHLFGAVSSPGCANYGLKYLAKENCHSHPIGSQFIAKDFYVDDGVTSTDTVEKAIQLTQEAREICSQGGLRLHKFVSNSHAVLQGIPPSECAVDTKTKDLTFNDMPQERALGIHWSINGDSFRFNNTLKDQPATRRGILSTVASIYDPLGFLAPYILTGKRILQEMCHRGRGWDDPLPEVLKPRWESWRHDFVNLEKVNIARCYLPANFGEAVETELHHFSDASTSGYGQCSYLRAKNLKGEIHCSLVIAKARVPPTKLTTIPRLELTAAAVSVNVSNMLREELGCVINKEYFWTDSKVVLGYINNEARRFHTFVANRVQKIRQSTSPQQWFYIPSEDNPADSASRGKTVSELISSNWFTGPMFLWERELPTPKDVMLDLPLGDPEIRKAQTLLTKTTEPLCLADRLSRFSSWSRATKAVARLLRRAKKIKSHAPSTISEQESAEKVIIQNVQSQAYEKEIKLLNKGSQLPRHNKLHQLDVFLDTGGILKVGGRLHHSSLADSLKHPIVLPKEHHVTALIIAHNHDRVKHQGKGFTTNEIRSSGYWIPGMSSAVASYIRQCVICRKLRRPPEGQRMSDLPIERVEPAAPFTHCGMDCFGPFVTTEGRKQHKRYGLLLTCLCSRAIHIEMLEDLTTDALINGLRCFIAIRGAIRQIKCDQGTNFVGAQNEFKAALKELDRERLSMFLSQKQCDFIMNAPHSSHAGGVWERQIRTVRSVLNATLSLAHGRLNDTSLRTLFYEAMAIVNSRPLTVDTLNSPDSLEPLTPNHLLQMKSSTALPPPGTFHKEDLYGRKRWRRVQFLAEQFWSRWRREYLHNIIARQRWHSPKRNLQVGDIVMDADELLPRGEWRISRILETVSGKDGLVRRVKISVGDKTLNKKGERSGKLSVLERPVQKLVLLLEAS